MATVTNEFIGQLLPTAKQYCMIIYKPGPTRHQPDAEQIQWEHVRYLLQLREDGKLLMPCPVIEEASEVMGIGILNTTDKEEAEAILKEDPNVKAGRLVYELILIMGFPGDGLK